MPEDVGLEIIIATQLSKTAAEITLTLDELINTMLENGMSKDAIKQVLMRDLNTGGRLFGNYRNQVKSKVKAGMNMAANKSSRKVFEEAGVKEYTWISVGDKSVCIDCEDRHGETDVMEYFKTVGLPRSGFSICQFNCRCQLIPATYRGENLDKPLLRQEFKK